MEDFTIETHLTTREYVRVMFIGLYKKPGFILASVVGLFLVTTSVLNYMEVVDYYTYNPLADILLGLLLLLAPALIVLISVRQFISNPSFKHNIIYTFSDNGIIVQGLTFKAEFLWAHIIKQKELSKFLILYQSKKFGNFIDRTKMTTSQLQFIKSKVGQK